MQDSKIVSKLSGKVILGRYLFEQKIGTGSYGTIYRGVDKETSERVAIKIIPTQQLEEIPELVYLIPNEIDSLKKISNVNVVKYLADYKSATNIYIVMEYCNEGDVAQKLKKNHRFPEPTALEYFCQILNAYKAMHEHGIMHRDIKLENIMIKDGVLKVVDFGFAKIFQGQQLQNQMTETVLGSPVYMAPEVLEGKPYGFQAEVYSLGVTLYWMVYGNPPYQYKNLFMPSDQELIDEIKAGSAEFNKPGVVVSEELLELIKSMLQYDVKKRLTFEQLFKKQIIRNIWAIDQTRGEGRLGLPEQHDFIKFKVDEEKDDSRFEKQEEESKQIGKQIQSIKKIKQEEEFKDIQKKKEVIQQNNQSDDSKFVQEEVDDHLIGFQGDQELLYKQANQQQIESNIQHQFIYENYQYDDTKNSQFAKSLFTVQEAKICYVKTRELATAFMLKFLIVENQKLYDGFTNRKNIYSFKQFESLQNHPTYIAIKNQFEQNTYPIINDHKNYLLRDYLHQIKEKDIRQLLSAELITQQDINKFQDKYCQTMKQYYEEVKVCVYQALNSQYLDRIKKDHLILQIRILIACDIDKIFPKGSDNSKFIQFEQKLNQSKQSNNWQKELEQIIQNLEAGQT